MELWEPRFKALRAVTKYGIDIIGIETNVIDILQRWIEGAFEGLLAKLESVDRSESAERERSLEILVKFLEEVLTRTETVSRITDEKMASIFFFYTSLVDRSISLQDIVRGSLATLPSGSSSTGSNRHQSVGHRRNLSSLSVSSLPSVSSSLPQIAPPSKTASECAIAFYLRHINAHLKSLSHTHLGHIIPVLFRALASCSASLPRLSAAMKSPKKNTLDEKLSEVLNSLFAGPYAANCMLILRQHLFPRPITPYSSNTCWTQDHHHQLLQLTVMTSLGAHRTLRNHIRRALYARIARSYISREATFGYSQSGAPSHLDLQQEWIEKAWPKEDFAPSSAGVGGNGWDAARIGKALADSVGTWISHQFDEVGTYNSQEERKLVGEKEQQGKEEILEEASGILKDILQELDTRVDERSELDEDEARVIGLTLLKLTEYILPLKCVWKCYHWTKSDIQYLLTGSQMAHPSSSPLINLMMRPPRFCAAYRHCLHMIIIGPLILYFPLF
jgi:tuberous sclerosis protein 2